MADLAVVSGLDPSGGAGFIADTRVAVAHGLRPVGVVTALTEQDTRGVRRVEPVSPELVGDQLRALLSDVQVDAIKIGMLGSEAVARAVAGALALTSAPVVWDPVVRPSSGSAALYDGHPSVAFELLAPHLAIMTPNLPEAAALVGAEVTDVASMRAAAVNLAKAGNCAVLVTGGHLQGDRAIDVLALGDRLIEIEGERIATDGSVHGTGCALSTALACGLALGESIEDAVRLAKELVARKLRDPVRPGRGTWSVM